MFYKNWMLAIVIAGLSATSVYAKCPNPSNPPSHFPNGAKASKADMLGAKKSVDEYIASARAYVTCVDKDEAAQLKKMNADPKMDKDARAKEMKMLQARHKHRNDVVTQMQATAKAFNDEIHKYNKQ